MRKKKDEGGLFGGELPKIKRVTFQEAMTRRTWKDSLRALVEKAEERKRLREKAARARGGAQS